MSTRPDRVRTECSGWPCVGTRRLYLVALGWFGLVCVTGVSADSARYSLPFGLLAAAGALVSMVCLAVSLRTWQHLLALPLYAFFGMELLVFATAFLPK